jgi:hypothetical protein
MNESPASNFGPKTAYRAEIFRAFLHLLQANNRQVTGSIPDGVIGIFQLYNPSGHIMALGSTQPLTEMSTSCISWG